MLAYNFSRVSLRSRLGFYNLLSPDGKVFLANLLEAELETLNKFKLDHASGELRRLQHKADKGTATEEELKILLKSPLEFEGALLPIGTLPDKEGSHNIVREYLKAKEIILKDLEQLRGSNVEETRGNSHIILSRPVYYWNLHPNLFTPAVYREIFQSPEYVRDELRKMFILKLADGKVEEPSLVFPDKREIEEILSPIKFLDYYDSLFVNLSHLRYLDENDKLSFKDNLVNVITLLIEEDKNFNLATYKVVKDVLPQYNNKKLRYFINLVCQYNSVGSTQISSRIDLFQIYAMYRKAEELC